ncbi:MAG: hypothetical protein GWO02_06675 [Gammaproteobacteria bacterium]|nr:hypothetical protein [Gammaproteobacteria bacterium]
MALMQDPRLEGLLSSDPDHFYTEEELDAIEALDPEMALRIDRAQTQAERAGAGAAVPAEGPVDARRVAEAIEEVRRILAQDGGDIELIGIEGKVVRVRMKGACVGCPNSVLDLRNVVQRVVKARVPQVADVVNTF